MSSRSWIKIYCAKVLNSDDIGADLSALGAWLKLLCIAGDSSSGDIGVIQINEFIGFTDAQIADLMRISTRQWRRYKDIFVTQQRITITHKNVIIINNWSKYQSEYGRQKGYRQGYKQGYKKPNPEVVTKGATTERENKIKTKNTIPVDNVDNSPNLPETNEKLSTPPVSNSSKPLKTKKTTTNSVFVNKTKEDMKSKKPLKHEKIDIPKPK